MSDYRLFHGDCLALLPALEDRSIDAIITDIPSGRTACAWDSVIPFDLMWPQLQRIIKPKGAIVLLGCTQPFTSALIMSNPKLLKEELIWEKDRATGFLDASRMHLKAHEQILVFAAGAVGYNPQKTNGHKISRPGGSGPKGSRVYHGAVATVATGLTTDRFPRSVLKFNTVNSAHKPIHPTQKPLALLEYLVRTYTNPGATVLDFCFGSGTTGAACGNLDRSFVGMELYPLLDRPIHPKSNPDYFNPGSQRIASAYAPLLAMEQAAQ